MKPRNFFAELKRRNVYKVAVAYAVVAWLLIQAASIILPTFEAPAWTLKVLIAALAVGLPIAVVLAWAFEITPEGIVRAEEVVANESITRRTGRKLTAIIVVVAVIAAALFAFQFVRKQNPSSRSLDKLDAAGSDKSIAVLPFENATGDANLDYLSDGVSESVLDRLSQLPQLKVIARSSSFQYRKQPDLKAVASTLGVQTVVTGRVTRRDESYIIRVDLADVKENRQLWGANFTRKTSDVQVLQTDISREIVETLRLRLSGVQTRQLASQSANPQAYELLLKGRFYYNKFEFGKAIDYYEQAVAADPDYALAHAELAEAFRWGEGKDPKQRRLQAETSARKALELDPNLAEAHFALAGIKRDAWDWEETGREYRRTLELNSNLPQAHSGYASYLSLMGRHDEARAEAKRAQVLDPLSPRINGFASSVFLRAGRYSEAIEASRRILELNPNSPHAHARIGDVHAAKGMYWEAIAEYQEAISLDGGDAPNMEARLGWVFVKAGERAKAEEILQKIRSTQNDVSPGELAVLQAALGNREEAFALLERALAERDSRLPYIVIGPLLDPLRDDPRFADLVRRIGLQP